MHHCAHIHCLVSINVQQVLMNVNGCNFSAWRNLITHLCFIRTSMSDTMLSECPSAAICHMATTRNRILLRRFSLYCHTTNICLSHSIQTWKKKQEALLLEQLLYVPSWHFHALLFRSLWHGFSLYSWAAAIINLPDNFWGLSVGVLLMETSRPGSHGSVC